MRNEFSIYLDLVRLLAALLVVVWHSNNRAIIAEVLPWSQYGHSAVIVFFVLSGLVIAYVSDTKERLPRDYAVSRLARIYSVAPAALLLALVLDPLGILLDPGLYSGSTTHDFVALRLASSLLFLNEVWGVSIMAFSNVPYWSLNYEVWYYLLFAVATFMGGRRRFLVFAGICVLLGPKILLLAPVWWLGVYLYRCREDLLSERAGLVFFVLSFPLVYLFHRYAVDQVFTQWLKSHIGEALWTQLVFSKYFLSDYLLAVLIAMNFAGFRAIAHRFSGVFAVSGNTIRFFAGFTFSLYLFHQPLILFFAALIDGDPQRPWFYVETMALVLLAVFLLGSVTEKQKRFYRRQANLAVDWALSGWRLLYPLSTVDKT